MPSHYLYIIFVAINLGIGLTSIHNVIKLIWQKKCEEFEEVGEKFDGVEVLYGDEGDLVVYVVQQLLLTLTQPYSPQ